MRGTKLKEELWWTTSTHYIYIIESLGVYSRHIFFFHVVFHSDLQQHNTIIVALGNIVYVAPGVGRRKPDHRALLNKNYLVIFQFINM